MLEEILKDIVSNFNFTYIITVNILTYIIISSIDYINGKASVNTVQKRLILVLSVIICGLIYYYTDTISTVILVNSSIAAPVFWSWVLRPIFIKCGLGYKQIDKYLK